MGLMEILRLPEVQRFSGSNAELFRHVRNLAKQNVGHGISAEYYATRFEFGGTIHQGNIGGLVKCAKLKRGCFSKANMQIGLRKYWAKKAVEKQIDEENK